MTKSIRYEVHHGRDDQWHWKIEGQVRGSWAVESGVAGSRAAALDEAHSLGALLNRENDTYEVWRDGDE